MFDLTDKTGYSNSTIFYEYAKALAILRENYMRHRALADSKVPGLIDKAISSLLKQVQE